MSKYDNLKTLARKVVANKRSYCKGTGGGPFVGDDLDPIVEAILKIINVKTVIGIDFTGDSDGFSVTNNNINKRNINNYIL